MIRELLEAEIAAVEERHTRGRSMFEKAGDYAPLGNDWDARWASANA